MDLSHSHSCSSTSFWGKEVHCCLKTETSWDCFIFIYLFFIQCETSLQTPISSPGSKTRLGVNVQDDFFFFCSFPNRDLIAEPPVHLPSRQTQKHLNGFHFSPSEHIWHMTQVSHSRLAAPVHITSFCQSDCAAIVRPAPSPSIYSPLGPVQEENWKKKKKIQGIGCTKKNALAVAEKKSTSVCDPANKRRLARKTQKEIRKSDRKWAKWGFKA